MTKINMQDGTRLAVVDLGSNSFRLEMGHSDGRQFRRANYFKETVRLGNGLDGQSRLTRQAMQKGWDCLSRFGEQLRTFHPQTVSAVATQTLREASNRDDFLNQASNLLGFRIQTISGDEEARLIYQGVAQTLPDTPEHRLVIDIGGRSTELIVGTGMYQQHLASYPVGSVMWSMCYFPEGHLSAEAFAAAETAARSVLAPACTFCSPNQWDVAYGSAGTVNAVVDVLTAAGWPAGYVSHDGLNWLLEKLLAAHSAGQLSMAGLREDRKAIIGGGLSILRALFSLLSITRMEQSLGGLRHGLLMDLLREKP
ncbi:Ppx/GppA family phosphatase [Rhodoferax sp.]|uniref:Ppx/GppA family phosphatase n=1 Tax=Rhodoferax sp. TaxID=50421 RepID=UPI0028451AD3|nr:Ppx/GppA family phosphatase [Rhodoferax sp.]MDR3368044.1 Ppx/GppA family phosphatase [Rhodoferax sp.]